MLVVKTAYRHDHTWLIETTDDPHIWIVYRSTDSVEYGENFYEFTKESCYEAIDRIHTGRSLQSETFHIETDNMIHLITNDSSEVTEEQNSLTKLFHVEHYRFSRREIIRLDYGWFIFFCIIQDKIPYRLDFATDNEISNIEFKIQKFNMKKMYLFYNDKDPMQNMVYLCKTLASQGCMETDIYGSIYKGYDVPRQYYVCIHIENTTSKKLAKGISVKLQNLYIVKNCYKEEYVHRCGIIGEIFLLSTGVTVLGEKPNKTRQLLKEMDPYVDISVRPETIFELDKEKLSCYICMEQERIYANIPCGHVTSCENCIELLSDICVICREDVERRMRIYL